MHKFNGGELNKFKTNQLILILLTIAHKIDDIHLNKGIDSDSIFLSVSGEMVKIYECAFTKRNIGFKIKAFREQVIGKIIELESQYGKIVDYSSVTKPKLLSSLEHFMYDTAVVNYICLRITYVNKQSIHNKRRLKRRQQNGDCGKKKISLIPIDRNKKKFELGRSYPAYQYGAKYIAEKGRRRIIKNCIECFKDIPSFLRVGRMEYNAMF